jgi:hypothetical protein
VRLLLFLIASIVFDHFHVVIKDNHGWLILLAFLLCLTADIRDCFRK